VRIGSNLAFVRSGAIKPVRFYGFDFLGGKFTGVAAVSKNALLQLRTTSLWPHVRRLSVSGALALMLSMLSMASLGSEHGAFLAASIATGFLGTASFLNRIHCADALEFLRKLPPRCAQTVISDPPYFRVLLKESWDNQWPSFGAYLDWSLAWLKECMRVIRPNGLCFVFGQVGRRECGFFDFCSRATHLYRFHDLIIWDRAVGYQRRDSVDTAYEQIFVLRNSDEVKFRKDRVRTSYDEQTIARYVRDRRYKNAANRLEHLRKGRFATNIMRVPSLRGSSREKAGHPSQKPLGLIRKLVLLSTDESDVVLDPFAGSGTTAVAAAELGRQWVGIERKPRYCRMAAHRLASVTASQSA